MVKSSAFRKIAHLSITLLFFDGISTHQQTSFITALSLNSPHLATEQHHRRSFLSKTFGQAALVTSIATPPQTVAALVQSTDDNESSPPSSPPVGRITKLSNGVQYSDVLIGHGPPISPSDVVLLHIKARTMDGKNLIDTKLDGERPILHELGSAVDFNIFGGDSSKRGKVTIGVEDVISSSGSASWEGGFGRADPMREGGVRLAVVPAALAYGNAGVSRYDAYKMQLRKAVPRDEVIRYEIEVLRCRDVEVEFQGEPGSGASRTMTVQACCPDEEYPCKTPVGERKE